MQVMFVSCITYYVARLADIAKQNQSKRIDGLPVTAEDEFSHYRGLHVKSGE